MPKRILQGKVISHKADKTVSVAVQRTYKDPVTRKIVRSIKKYAAHDHLNEFKEGDIVFIQESRPISKTKTWQVCAKPE